LVIWTDPAIKSLKQIHDFIATDSKYYAKETIDKIIQKSDQLPSFPNMGRIVPEIQNNTIREIFVYSYRLMYQIKGNNIYILAVIHGKKNFDGSI
jgi:plasmid stabilization system protein ParE